MGRYRVRVATGGSAFAGSNNQVQLWLVGELAEEALELRLRPSRGKVEEFSVDVKKILGPLLFVKVCKRRLLTEDSWFCEGVTVQGPGDSGLEAAFPCYRWVRSGGPVHLPEGTGEAARSAAAPLHRHRSFSLPTTLVSFFCLGSGRLALLYPSLTLITERAWEDLAVPYCLPGYPPPPPPVFLIPLWPPDPNGEGEAGDLAQPPSLNSNSLGTCGGITSLMSRSPSRRKDKTTIKFPTLDLPLLLSDFPARLPSTPALIFLPRCISDLFLWIETTCTRTVKDDPQGFFKAYREEELKERKKQYSWHSWKDNVIRTVSGATLSDLPLDERFHEEKRIDFECSLAKGLKDLAIKDTLNILSSWKSLEDFNRIFWSGQSRLAEKVRDSWKEDAFFGYQFLNGANPMILRRSTELPSRLKLPPGSEELQAELERHLQIGSLFEADFSLLNGIQSNVILCCQQYLAAPLVMLKLDPDGNLMPIAIQIQLPSSSSPTPPVFLPSDPPMAWLLAKAWVRSSDFQLHQLQYHLLRGHLMAEVISVATMRCLPTLHPIFKILIPHLRYTLEINIRARTGLVSDGGVFDQVVSTGGGGHVTVLQKAGNSLTYRSLCPPHDLADRKLLGVPSCYYAHDALRLWEIIKRYVEGIVHLYYPEDEAVGNDPELQAWCKEITEIGLHGAQDRGFPTSFHSRDDLCFFVTMCIFTCTGQHSSVHQGQLDWYAWVPNAPCTMRKPPPNTKDVTLEMVMATLPNVHQASLQMSLTWQLGRAQPNMISLGQHKEEYFSESGPKAVLSRFREDLAILEQEIIERNAKLDLPYEYLQPSRVENSVTI